MFVAFLVSQGLSVVFNSISDCDETFNYWEPTHFLQHGSGLQTWEYSPEYALRSYAYLYPQLLVGKLSSWATPSKIAQFYLIRLFLGLVSSLGMTYLCVSIKERYGKDLAFYTFLFLLFSTGIYIAGTAFLPSSFAMYCLMVCQAAWIRKNPNYSLCIFCVALCSIAGWPFAALVGVPLALQIMWKKGLVFFVTRSVLWGSLCLGVCGVIDYCYYQKPVIAAWNILKYNVFESHGGPELYGVEPWFFYIMNAFLNFNFVLFLAFLAIPTIVISALCKSKGQQGYGLENFLHHCSFPLWFIFMSSIPHKEERFLFVVYPHLCFSAALTLTSISNFLKSFKKTNKLASAFILLLIVSMSVISVSRTVSLYQNYSAPIHIYKQLSGELTQNHFPYEKQVNVCVGGEWYRFPNSYFLPSRHHNLTFIYDGPTGQLPQYYPSTASQISPNFNDLNKEEPSRYIPLDQCHYIVDRLPKESIFEKYDQAKWETILSEPFLDAPNSHKLFRAFYVPYLSQKKNTWSSYFVLRKI
uniref:Mannosyltransferase n=1 Tax=Arcella intermedia TaxID=1963864 RepID=A0A6B2L1M8_9EUKA|eukprot:TRINITY_DN19820_c3_g2_i1.p1 TRINITY_DN19820_c3_g2~~TRINITY_DN19820_c3_g2_i1.p1  ORF type:complete len:574 (+),score=97.44 TRINITY_DN19820_c3_g2_i1:145-1722(+)